MLPSQWRINPVSWLPAWKVIREPSRNPSSSPAWVTTLKWSLPHYLNCIDLMQMDKLQDRLRVLKLCFWGVDLYLWTDILKRIFNNYTNQDIKWLFGHVTDHLGFYVGISSFIKYLLNASVPGSILTEEINSTYSRKIVTKLRQHCFHWPTAKWETETTQWVHINYNLNKECPLLAKIPFFKKMRGQQRPSFF